MWRSVLPCSRVSTSCRTPTGSSSVSSLSWLDMSAFAHSILCARWIPARSIQQAKSKRNNSNAHKKNTTERGVFYLARYCQNAYPLCQRRMAINKAISGSKNLNALDRKNTSISNFSQDNIMIKRKGYTSYSMKVSQIYNSFCSKTYFPIIYTTFFTLSYVLTLRKRPLGKAW